MTVQSAQSANMPLGAAAAVRMQTVAVAVGAIALGVLLLSGMAFAHNTVLHDSAHDARHGLNVPCH